MASWTILEARIALSDLCDPGIALCCSWMPAGSAKQRNAEMCLSWWSRADTILPPSAASTTKTLGCFQAGTNVLQQAQGA